jgi:hypothetical protein
VGWLCLIGLAVHAGPLVTAESPIGFFANVARRLLQSQLNLGLDRIQLYLKRIHPLRPPAPAGHRQPV